jgi:hypothetical protein
MSKPIEGCPQPDEPMRDRAWTAEQVDAMADAYFQDTEDVDQCGAMLRAFAATLRQPTNPPEIGSKLVGQQAEQAGGLVSDKLQRVYKAARGLCHGYDWNKGTAARYHRAELLSAVNDIEPVPDVGAKIEAVAPLLRAPAEQAKRLECRFGEGGIGIVPGDVAGRPAVFLTEVAAPGEVGKPIPKGECGETRVVLTFPTKEQASRVVAALAQNAQGKAVGWISDNDLRKMQECDDEARNVRVSHVRTHLRVHQIFLQSIHAERARVPAESWTGEIECCDAKGFWLVLADNCPFVPGQRVTIAAAPSQPEDANCSHTWVTDGIGPTRCSKCRKQPEDAALLRAVRAHDREEATQKGEPDPWAEDFPEPYRSERLTAMRCAFNAAAPSQPTQAVDVGYDDALNDAGWAFIEAMPVQLPGPIFNNVKTALKAAIEKWIATRALTSEKSGPVGKYRLLGPNDVIEPDDEFIDDNAVDWVRAGSASGGHLFIGMQYRLGVLKQARRPLPASPAPDKEG